MGGGDVLLNTVKANVTPLGPRQGITLLRTMLLLAFIYEINCGPIKSEIFRLAILMKFLYLSVALIIASSAHQN